MPFKEGKLDITTMIVVNVNMQSATTIDQSWLPLNTSMVAIKSIQSMENKIDKLNKNIDQYKKEFSLKNKIIAKLQN